MRIPALALSLALFSTACMLAPVDPASPAASERPPSPFGRDLGTLSAIYPFPREDGGYDLELRMSKDTVWVDVDALRAYAADSLGRALFRSTTESFFTRDERCFHSPKKAACLEFRTTPFGVFGH